MKNLNFKNFSYALIDSAKKGYKEVLVTYNISGSTLRQREYVFVKEIKGKNNNYYIDEAKKEINGRIATGALNKSSIKQLKRSSSKGILKPALIALAVILGVGAVGTGGYFTYQAINGQSSGQGGGGGGGFKPGDSAPVDINMDNIPEGIDLKISKNAVVGEAYSAEIELDDTAANGIEYTMPKDLDEVTYKKGTQDVEISNYTYTLLSKTTAKLDIDAEYVLGPINIKLTPQQAEVEDVTLICADATTNCKITYNGNPFDAKNPITVNSGKSFDLVCEALNENYSITNDSFEFTPALPAETGWTWEGKANKLHIYNLVAARGASTSYALTVSPIKDPIEISVTRYDTKGYGSGLHLFYGDDEIPDSPKTETPILINGDKCAFRVELDKGYTITDEGFTIYPGARGKPLPPDNYSYAEGMLIIEDVPFDEIGGLRIETNVYYTTNYRSTKISLAEHCKVIYRGNTYGLGDEISVYPDEDGFVQFDIITYDGYVMCDYDAVVRDFFDISLDIAEFYQTADNHYSVVVSYSGTSPLDEFYALFRASKLPDTYILLDKDSVDRGSFWDNSLQRYVPFYDLRNNIHYNEISGISFYANNNYIDYIIASVDGLMPDYTYYYASKDYDDPSEMGLHFGDYYIEKGDHITIKLLEPTSDPYLRLDSAASEDISFTDSSGEPISGGTYLENVGGWCEFYFKFNDSNPDDINIYNFYINGFPYEIDINDEDGYYSGDINVGQDWVECNLELKVNLPVEISLGDICEDKCVLHHPFYDRELSSDDSPIAFAPDRNGDIAFECYLYDYCTDNYLLTTKSFTVTGSITGYEYYDNGDDYTVLIVHGVTGGFNIESIEPGSRYVEILTSTDTPTKIFNIRYYRDTISNTETPIRYDMSDPILRFNIEPQTKDYVIDTECYITYTTNDSKEEKKLYGIYNSGGFVTFNPDDLSSITSMKIHLNYKHMEFESKGGINITYDSKIGIINRVNICGCELRPGGAPIDPRYVSTPILDIYVSSSVKPTVGGISKSGLTLVDVEDLGNRNGEFNYRIILSGNTAETMATIVLN